MLKSIKIKDYTFKIDSLRQELEGLIELSDSKQSRQHIVEKINKFNFAFQKYNSCFCFKYGNLVKKRVEVLCT